MDSSAVAHMPLLGDGCAWIIVAVFVFMCALFFAAGCFVGAHMF